MGSAQSKKVKYLQEMTKIISCAPKYSVWKTASLKTFDFILIIVLEKPSTTLQELTKLKSNPKTPLGGKNPNITIKQTNKN